ncbi:MAG: 2-hydroxymuconic semialdehyde dehydrogenase [Gammaproteobacteria bacterium]|nr:MAG: 2-hydroxymuconic semialdehyde dehydrogenase [Gammaproteobacteria bacterium]RLA11639.1 MAG: 2-hydroxymuconic semialdehyde dehydrogenase [Gammaproteobacteria bacterium]
MKISSFINGVYVDSKEQRNIKSPVTGELITPYSVATDAQVNEAVEAARAALNGPWGSMGIQERVDILYKVADGISARFDEFLEAECLDTGKPYSLARHIDIPRGAANFRIFADTIKNVADEAFHMPTPDGTGALNYTVRKPKGVIGVIGPWNLPLLLMTWKIGPALACGNTVIVKPSEETQLTMTMLGEVMNEAGVPPGVFNTVLGPGSRVGDKLISHPGLDAITFTGSTATGERVAEAASVGLRDASLELGGKNAAIVFADADIDKAIEGTVRSVFVNCGQVCLGTERVYVERPIFDEFVARLKAEAEKYKFGRPEDPETTMGPLISATHRDKVLSYYEKAVEAGATVVIGGGVPDMPAELAGGNWVEPTIWTGMAEDAIPMREEIFGPCCHITPFDTEEEAVRMANDSPYGLASAIWTENASRAHRVGAQMEVGISWVNSWFLRDLRTPFGGAKQSGIGREGGHYSLEFYTELTNVCIKL